MQVVSFSTILEKKNYMKRMKRINNEVKVNLQR
jgi:hypothetical protein